MDENEKPEFDPGRAPIETPEETAAREEAEANPQPPNPDPPAPEPFGKVLYDKDGTATNDERAQADIVIEDATVPIIVKDREGLIGVVASPELLSYAYEPENNDK